jgi:hypothetical protein
MGRQEIANRDAERSEELLLFENIFYPLEFLGNGRKCSIVIIDHLLARTGDASLEVCHSAALQISIVENGVLVPDR